MMPLNATDPWTDLLENRNEAGFQLAALGDEDIAKALRQKYKKFNEDADERQDKIILDEKIALEEKYQIKKEGAISQIANWNEVGVLIKKIHDIRLTAKNSLNLSDLTVNKHREYFRNHKLSHIASLAMILKDVYIYKIIEAMQQKENARALALMEDFAFLYSFVAPGGSGVNAMISHFLLHLSMPNPYREKLRTLREELENRRFQFFRQDTSEVEKDK